jgi:hypothetical protein
MRRSFKESDENVLDPVEEEVEPEEDPIPNYVPIPKTTEIIENYPAKKKDRTLGNSVLVYPRGSEVIITQKNFQFYAKETILNFLGGLYERKPVEIVTQVQEKFEGCQIGVARGVEGKLVNIVWTEPGVRFYYDPEAGEEVKFMPKCIKT